MTGITETTHRYDSDRLLLELAPVFELKKDMDRTVGVMINHEEGDYSLFSDYLAVLNPETNMYTTEYNQKRILHKMFHGTYMEEVYRDIERRFVELGMQIGRSRMLTVGPLQALMYHKDYDGFRMHVPLITNGDVVFLSDGVVGRMPEAGRLYYFDTSTLHSAINWSVTESRVHLVFDAKHDLAKV